MLRNIILTFCSTCAVLHFAASNARAISLRSAETDMRKEGPVEIVPCISGNRVEVWISGIDQPIWQEWAGPPGWSLVPPDNANFAVLAVLAYCMERGLSMHVRGSADTKLLRNAERLTRVWASWQPSRCRPVTISADKEFRISGRDDRKGHCFPLSGGVDASFSLSRCRAGLDGREVWEPACAFYMRGIDYPIAMEDRWCQEVT